MSEGKGQKPRPRRLPVKIQVDKSTVSMFFDSEIMNLSKGGVFIRADIVLPTGSEVEFEFKLPKSKRLIHAKGVVVWARRAGQKPTQSFPVHSAGMGVQFKEISLDDVEAILEEIERHSAS